MKIVNDIELQFEQIAATPNKKIKQVFLDGIKASTTPGFNPYHKLFNPIKYNMFESGVYCGRYYILESKKSEVKDWELIVGNKIKEFTNMN